VILPDRDKRTPVTAQQQITAENIMAALLHRLVMAAGGAVSIRVEDVPSDLPFRLEVRPDNLAVLHAGVPQARKAALVAAGPETLNKLRPIG